MFFELAPQDLLSRSPGIFAFGSFKKVSSTVLPSYFRAETQRFPETALVRSINEPCYLNTTSQLSKNFTMTDDHITTSSIDATLGAVFLGVAIMCMLMGIVIIQTCTYFRSFGDDHAWLKAIVGIMFILEVGQAVSVIHHFYIIGVTGYGNPAALLILPKSFGAIIVITILLKLIAGMYYAYRILILTSNKLLAIVPVILHISWMAIAINIAARSLTTNYLPEFYKATSWVNFAAFLIWLVTDLYTSVVLIIWLVTRRRDVVMPPMIKVLDSILLWAIQTGSITSLFSMVLLITHKLMPETFIYMVFYVIQPKLYSNSLLARFPMTVYSNSLLASLNARALNQYGVTDVLDGDAIAGCYRSATAPPAYDESV